MHAVFSFLNKVVPSKNPNKKFKTNICIMLDRALQWRTFDVRQRAASKSFWTSEEKVVSANSRRNGCCGN
jgi:hypothetical protein